METNELLEIVEQMKIRYGNEFVLDELCRALSSKELEENLKWLNRCYDMNLITE